MSDPWAFGWTQLLTLAGLLLTVAIAIAGFRSFGRWKREQLELRRIEIAIEALSIAYESGPVFDHIRSVMASEYEWKDMDAKDRRDGLRAKKARDILRDRKEDPGS